MSYVSFIINYLSHTEIIERGVWSGRLIRVFTICKKKQTKKKQKKKKNSLAISSNT